MGPDDWKTNHRVYEYYPEHASQEELEALVNDGYDSFIGAWKSVQGLKELIHILLVNSTARSVILGNIRNPAARKVVTDGLKQF